MKDNYWDDIPLERSQYDAYAGDVWAAGVCLLTMCTGRAPFPSLALPPLKRFGDNNASVERTDWALNAWNEGESGSSTVLEMLGSLQPSIIKKFQKVSKSC